MARETYSVRFGQQQLLVEEPAESGIFGAPCGITGLTRNVTTNTNDVSLPPCEDPEAVIWLGVDAVSKRMTLTFTGTLADNALPIWDAWSMGSEPRLVRWYRNLDAPNRGYWEGLALLTEYTEESTDRGRYTNSGTIIFDGEPEWFSIPPAPENTALPTISGTPQVGVVLTAADGTWTGTPSYTHQWFADGIAIAGADEGTYTPVAADEGKMITVRVTGTNASGSMTANSAAVGPVAAA